MTATSSAPAESGLIVLDKPAGWTSHQVVGRVRRLVGTRKVGHASYKYIPKGIHQMKSLVRHRRTIRRGLESGSRSWRHTGCP